MKKQDGVARYEQVDAAYIEQRTLRKSAGWKLLWALGVGAVISGDYFGWNYGLATGGFWGLAIATVVMAAMYVCMVYSIAELSAALPYAGGFYTSVGTRRRCGHLWRLFRMELWIGDGRFLGAGYRNRCHGGDVRLHGL